MKILCKFGIHKWGRYLYRINQTTRALNLSCDWCGSKAGA